MTKNANKYIKLKTNKNNAFIINVLYKDFNMQTYLGKNNLKNLCIHRVGYIDVYKLSSDISLQIVILGLLDKKF